MENVRYLIDEQCQGNTVKKGEKYNWDFKSTLAKSERFNHSPDAVSA